MKKLAIAIVASLAVFGASTTPALAASYTKQENKLWKYMKNAEPKYSKMVGKKDSVSLANSTCSLFDELGTDLGIQAFNYKTDESVEALDMPPFVEDVFREYSTQVAVAATYTLCKEHKKDLKKSINTL